MRPNIRWKLMGSYLLLVFLMGIPLYLYLNHTLEEYLTQEVRQNLTSEARLARLAINGDTGKMRRNATAIAAAIGRETKARVTIIAPDGKVVGDSQVPASELAGMENHANRPEVIDARAKGIGESIRYSSTLKTSMLYIALPFGSDGKSGDILRLALPLSTLESTTSNLHTILSAALAAAALLSLILSYIFSNVTSRTLREMAGIAIQIGDGRFGRRMPVNSRDELGDLARVMNEMAIRIEGQLENISAEKTRLDTILRGMGEGLMVTDARGTVTLVNPAFRTLFGLVEEVEGQPLINITRHPALNDAFRMVLDTRSERLEEITLSRNEETALLTHWVPLMEGEELQGVVAVFHNISDIRRMEKIRKDFVANVSHELRTPVAVIKGYAETLLSGLLDSDPERSARFVGIIHTHAERLADLISDLLTLSQMETGSLKMTLARITPEGIINRTATLLEQKAQAKQITIDCSGANGLPAVLADPGRLEQVLINLMDNAITYTSAGGSISILGESTADMVRISVRDTGIGIPARELPRIFERFYRVDAARSREEGGTGLGLSIVKHIIQLHGGSVAVDSTPGQGSTFSFTLKRA